MNRYDAMRELLGVAHGVLDGYAIQQKLTSDPDSQASLHEDWSRLRDAIDAVTKERDPHDLAGIVSASTAVGEFARAVAMIRNRLEPRVLSGEVDADKVQEVLTFLCNVAEDDKRYLEFIKDLNSKNSGAEA